MNATFLAIFLEAIVAVENPRNVRTRGPAGELGRFQITPAVAITAGGYDHAAGERHVRWLERNLPRIGVEPSAYNVALAWNAGIGRVQAGATEWRHRDFAERVCNLVERMLDEQRRTEDRGPRTAPIRFELGRGGPANEGAIGVWRPAGGPPRSSGFSIGREQSPGSVGSAGLLPVGLRRPQPAHCALTPMPTKSGYEMKRPGLDGVAAPTAEATPDGRISASRSAVVFTVPASDARIPVPASRGGNIFEARPMFAVKLP